MLISSLKPLLRECDTAIDLAKSGDIDAARVSLDRIRYFRSVLAGNEDSDGDSNRGLQAIFGGDVSLLSQYAQLAALVNQRLEFLHQWISQARASFTLEELKQSSQGMQLFIDDALPGVWDFKQDVLVVVENDGGAIREALRHRGQAKFIWITKDCFDASASSEDTGSDTAYFVPGDEDNPKKLEAILDSYSVPRVALITMNASVENEQNFHSVVRAIGSVVIGGTTSQWLQQQTSEQWLTLAPKLAELNSATLLKPILEDEDVLIVSPGPSLARDIQLLSAYQDRFVILAGVKALNALLDEGIFPDFAVWQDPRDHSFAIPERPEIKEVTLILAESCHPAFFEAGFKDYVFYPDPGFLGTELSSVLHGDDIPFLAGTSVSTLSAVLALVYGAKSLTLLGQDLSISEGLYVGGGVSTEPELEDGPSLMCKGIDGNDLPTQPNYYSFIGEFSNIGSAFRERALLINSTAKGAYLENWQHLPFSEHPVIVADPGFAKKPGEVKTERDTTERREATILALDQMAEKLEHAKRICAEIYRQCLETIEQGCNDVTVIDLLERRLKLIFDDECPLLKYYTSRQSLALTRATLSVQSLEENLRLSADYYKSIEIAASKLADLCRQSSEEMNGASTGSGEI